MTLMQRRMALMAAQEPTGPGWTDGVPYDNVQIIDGEYYETNGRISTFAAWSRTELLPCKGASRITLYGFDGAADAKYNCFYDQDGNFVSYFRTGHPETSLFTVSIPAQAAFFGLSWTKTGLVDVVNMGITPYA